MAIWSQFPVGSRRPWVFRNYLRPLLSDTDGRTHAQTPDVALVFPGSNSATNHDQSFLHHVNLGHLILKSVAIGLEPLIVLRARAFESLISMDPDDGVPNSATAPYMKPRCP